MITLENSKAKRQWISRPDRVGYPMPHDCDYYFVLAENIFMSLKHISESFEPSINRDVYISLRENEFKFHLTMNA